MGNPTDELRARLDELCIPWDNCGMHKKTYWTYGEAYYTAFEQGGKLLIVCTCVKYLTPEQAIAATVGAGTCKGEIDTDHFDCKLTTFKCHSCGWSGVVDDGYAGYSFGDTDMPRHCPNCGAKVVSE